MTNNNQSNPLSEITFVQDITPESAAAISGGARLSFGSQARGEIILHKDSNLQGQKLGLSDSEIGKVYNIGLFASGSETSFNDTTSSITVNEGTWQFFTNVGNGDTGVLAPGTYNLGANNDRITSIKRIS